MNNAPTILRSLVTFAVIVPLAVFVGYLLSDPLDRSSFTYYGILALILISPILLRYYHPLLILSWNFNLILFFLPGRLHLWLAMSAVGLGILVLQRALGGVRHIISVPQVTWSLICLVGVVLFTAKMTGMGLKSMGSEIYGGRHFVYLLGAIMGYFALSGRRIPPERAGLYVGLFFLGGLTGFIGDLFPVAPGSLRFIFWFFPPSSYSNMQNEITNMQGVRLSGALWTSLAVFSYMMAKYGIRGIFLSGKTWRLVVFFLMLIYSLFSGFRSLVITFALMFAVQFYLEGMHRTKLLPIFAFIGVSMAVLVVPLSTHLPYSIQRALSFLPLEVNRTVQQDAKQSWEWRVKLWKLLLPQIPKYLLLGKGYAVSSMEFDLITGSDAAIRVSYNFSENQYLALAGAYHNGPLSIVMTFGIWGCIAVVWFWIASMRVLYNNYCYGDPALRTVNTFLMIAYGVNILTFISIDYNMLTFCGLLGLSVSLNGGACRPPELARPTSKYPAFDDIRSHLQPTFRRPNIRA